MSVLRDCKVLSVWAMTHMYLICSTGESTLQDLQDQWRTEITGVAPEG